MNVSLNFTPYYLARTLAFVVLTRNCNFATRSFRLLTSALELVTLNFELASRIFKVLTHEFELVTRKCEPVTPI